MCVGEAVLRERHGLRRLGVLLEEQHLPPRLASSPAQAAPPNPAPTTITSNDSSGIAVIAFLPCVQARAPDETPAVNDSVSYAEVDPSDNDRLTRPPTRHSVARSSSKLVAYCFRILRSRRHPGECTSCRMPVSHLRVVDLATSEVPGRTNAGGPGRRRHQGRAAGGDPAAWFHFRGVTSLARPFPALPVPQREQARRGDRSARPRGRERLAELCDLADILIENLGPEAQRQHGLSPSEVRGRHPNLIHIAMADFGLAGPRAGWRAEPLPAFAASGALYASGLTELPPCWLPGYTAHDCASCSRLPARSRPC